MADSTGLDKIVAELDRLYALYKEDRYKAAVQAGKSLGEDLKLPDIDGTEIDLLFMQNRILHPVEIKKSGTPSRDWLRGFSALDRLKIRVGEGGVVCLCDQIIPLTETCRAIPAGLI